MIPDIPPCWSGLHNWISWSFCAGEALVSSAGRNKQKTHVGKGAAS